MNAQAHTQQRRQIPRIRDRRFSLLTTILALLLIIPPVPPRDFDYNPAAYTPDTSNPVAQVVLLLLLAISTIIVFVRIGPTLRLLRQVNVFFLLFVGLALVSLAWSIDAGLTMGRTLRLLIFLSAFLATAVAAWHPRRYQQLVRPALTFLVLGSIVFGLWRPDLAIPDFAIQPDGPWRGLATQKNALGALASFGFILWFHAWLTREVNPLSALVGAATAASCVVLSKSSTSLMATVFTSLFLLLLLKVPRSARRYMPYLVVLFAFSILIYSIAILKVVPGLEMLLAPIPMITGKDLTFTGRTDIWDALMDHIRLRPLFGSGYGAFWAGPTPTSESYYMLQRLQGFYPGEAHNGYLDVLNDLGVVGLLCLGGYLFVYVRQSLRLLAIDRTQGALFLALFIQQSITNLSEAHWFQVMSLDFILMSMATTSLASSLLNAGVRQAPTKKGPPLPPRVHQPSYVHSPFRIRRLK